MKLTEKDVKAIKAISTINKMIFFCGNEVSTKSEDASIAVYYQLEGDIDNSEQFSIFDSMKFLQLCDYYKNEIDDIQEDDKYLIFGKGKEKSTLFLSNTNYIINMKPTPVKMLLKEDHPRRKLTKENEITLTNDVFQKIKKQSKILSADHIIFEDKKLQCYVKGNQNDKNIRKSFGAGHFEIELDLEDSIQRKVIKTSSMMGMIADDYTVGVYNRALLFISKSSNVVYVVKLIMEN